MGGGGDGGVAVGGVEGWWGQVEKEDGVPAAVGGAGDAGEDGGADGDDGGGGVAGGLGVDGYLAGVFGEGRAGGELRESGGR